MAKVINIFDPKRDETLSYLDGIKQAVKEGDIGTLIIISDIKGTEGRINTYVTTGDLFQITGLLDMVKLKFQLGE